MADTGTTVYVLTHGKFVLMGGTVRSEILVRGLNVLRHMELTEHEWAPDPYLPQRLVLKYKPRRSGRWNVSDIVVTAVTLQES